MGRKSSIDQLDPRLRDELDRLIRDRRFTIDAILAHMQQMGAPLKRSAIGDYKKRSEERLARYREAQEVAGTWVRSLGESPDSKTGQLLAELLKTVAFRTLADMQDSDAGAEPEELMLLARALKDMAGAQKTDLEFRTKLRAEFNAEVAARAAAAAEAVVESAKATAGQQGLTAQAAENLRALVLGIVE